MSLSVTVETKDMELKHVKRCMTLDRLHSNKYPTEHCSIKNKRTVQKICA